MDDIVDNEVTIVKEVPLVNLVEDLGENESGNAISCDQQVSVDLDLETQNHHAEAGNENDIEDDNDDGDVGIIEFYQTGEGNDAENQGVNEARNVIVSITDEDRENEEDDEQGTPNSEVEVHSVNDDEENSENGELSPPCALRIIYNGEEFYCFDYPYRMEENTEARMLQLKFEDDEPDQDEEIYKHKERILWHSSLASFIYHLCLSLNVNVDADVMLSVAGLSLSFYPHSSYIHDLGLFHLHEIFSRLYQQESHVFTIEVSVLDEVGFKQRYANVCSDALQLKEQGEPAEEEDEEEEEANNEEKGAQDEEYEEDLPTNEVAIEDISSVNDDKEEFEDGDDGGIHNEYQIQIEAENVQQYAGVETMDENEHRSKFEEEVVIIDEEIETNEEHSKAGPVHDLTISPNKSRSNTENKFTSPDRLGKNHRPDDAIEIRGIEANNRDARDSNQGNKELEKRKRYTIEIVDIDPIQESPDNKKAKTLV